MQLHVLGFVTSYLCICHFLTLIAADNPPLNRNVTLVQADASLPFLIRIMQRQPKFYQFPQISNF